MQSSFSSPGHILPAPESQLSAAREQKLVGGSCPEVPASPGPEHQPHPDPHRTSAEHSTHDSPARGCVLAPPTVPQGDTPTSRQDRVWALPVALFHAPVLFQDREAAPCPTEAGMPHTKANRNDVSSNTVSSSVGRGPSLCAVSPPRAAPFVEGSKAELALVLGAATKCFPEQQFPEPSHHHLVAAL